MTSPYSISGSIEAKLWIPSLIHNFRIKKTVKMQLWLVHALIKLQLFLVFIQGNFFLCKFKFKAAAAIATLF